MKILGIGESVVDKTYLVHNFTENLANNSVKKNIGGPVLTAMILLARLDLDCTFLTTLGEDTDANIIKQTLRHEKIKVPKKLPQKTKVNTILVDKETGQRQKIRGITTHQNIKNIHTDFIQQFDLILIDRHEQSAFYEVLKKKKPSTKIIIDPSIEVSEFTYDMIQYSDYPIIPIESLIKIGEGKDLLGCLKKTFRLAEKLIIVTTGELGTIAYNGIEIILYPGISVNTIDTTGAGDIYRGAFAYGIAQAWEIKACIQYANKIAALQCTRLGNVSAIPTRNEIELCSNLFLSEKEITIPIVNEYFANLYQTL